MQIVDLLNIVFVLWILLNIYSSDIVGIILALLLGVQVIQVMKLTK
jgi:hypothetical protein